MKKANIFTSLLLAASLILSGCGASNTQKGGLNGTNNSTKDIIRSTGGGAVIGAGIGAILGGRKGALLGAVKGAEIGTKIGIAKAVIGQMEKQKAELERIRGAQVESVNEGQAIKVTFESGILFATGKSDLSAAAQSALTQFAASLNGTPDTNVMIYGHTDSSGGDEMNISLSLQRAQAVGNFLISKDVAENRITTQGMGSSQPVAPDDSKGVQALNRRVEIFIMPNAEMIRKAE